jgi:hypothetical protein
MCIGEFHKFQSILQNKMKLANYFNEPHDLNVTSLKLGKNMFHKFLTTSVPTYCIHVYTHVCEYVYP